MKLFVVPGIFQSSWDSNALSQSNKLSVRVILVCRSSRCKKGMSTLQVCKDKNLIWAEKGLAKHLPELIDNVNKTWINRLARIWEANSGSNRLKKSHFLPNFDNLLFFMIYKLLKNRANPNFENRPTLHIILLGILVWFSEHLNDN